MKRHHILSIFLSIFTLIPSFTLGQGYSNTKYEWPFDRAFTNCYNLNGQRSAYKIAYTITEIEQKVSPDQSTTTPQQRSPQMKGGDGAYTVTYDNTPEDYYRIVTQNKRFLFQKDERISYKITLTVSPSTSTNPDPNRCDQPSVAQLWIKNALDVDNSGTSKLNTNYTRYKKQNMKDKFVGNGRWGTTVEFTLNHNDLKINEYNYSPASYPNHPFYPDGGLIQNLGSILEVQFRTSTATSYFTLSLPIAIVGKKPLRLSDATITTPEIPFMILHDPPGDKSYSYQEVATKNCTGFKVSVATDESETNFNSLKLGTAGTVSFSPFGVGFEAYAQRTNEENVGIRETSNDSYEACMTRISRFQTAENSNAWTWKQGDQFITSAQQFKFGQVIEAWVDNDDYVRIARKTAMVAIGTPVLHNRSQYEIEEIEMQRQLAIIDDASRGADEKAHARIAYDGWQKLLDLNQRIKETRIGRFPVNVGSQSPVSNQTTESVTRSESYLVDMYVEGQVGFETGASFAGVSGTSGQKFTSKITLGDESISSEMATKTIYYKLQDDDPGDFFRVDRYTDPIFGTPFFVLNEEESITSYPYEGGRKKDNPVLEFSESSDGPWTQNLDVSTIE